MAQLVKIDPITRIEGHLAVNIEVESNRVANAYSRGEMFRGFELILKGRDPLDAQQITQRICGVCPVSHGNAAILAQDAAYGVRPPTNGRLLRNLILGANYLQSHIIHFYHLSALDFVDIAAITTYRGKDPLLQKLKAWVQSQHDAKVLHPAAPFLPRYEGHYIEDAEINLTAIRHYLKALEMRALAQRMGALFSGKMPHVASLVPGGVTEKVTAHKIAAYGSMLAKLQTFIDHNYLPDVVGVAAAYPDYFHIGKGPGNFMSYGVFPESDDHRNHMLPDGVWLDGQLHAFSAHRIGEDVTHAYYETLQSSSPAAGETTPAPHKTDAYTWVKAPRYDGQVVEVGPLARLWIAYHRNKPSDVKLWIERLLVRLGRQPGDLISTMGRHAARAIECKLVAQSCARWLSQLKPGEPAFGDFQIPAKATGVGLTEAPRGALGHWLQIEDHKVSRYQCVVPTTWNCSPRDGKNQAGPIEQALQGTPIADTDHPIEAARVVRSFDPCLACAIH
jgi:ferredoxin hydrogenase large subunit/hydrogenase large subunit